MNSTPEVLARAGAIDSRIVRALAAHLQTPDPVPVASSELAEAGGRKYVILRDGSGGVIKVYRVRSAPGGRDMLKVMRRPPAELREAQR